MDIINWSEFNGEKFQLFCNDLLSFEFGKNYVPFSAPGGDQGVDGLFEGNYNGKSGKWRFQAKFHHPDTGRVAGYNQLRNQVKQDLTDNIQDETAVVFITNVELNPQQRKGILAITNGIKNNKNSIIDFELWDGAKIYTILSHHPIVKLWYTNQTKSLIQEYSEFYHKELFENINTPYDFSNKYYYRSNKLEDLEKFINNDNKKVAVISGDAGIGKTRLCIEYFKQYIDHNNEWQALVIVTHTINLEVLQIALSGEKNYIVLLDDADKFNEKDIADLLTITKGIKQNKIKLLLTVRNHFLNQVLSALNAYDKTETVEDIKLKHLTKEETVQFLEEELKGLIIEEYLGYFVELTHGVPIMIMTLLKVIKNGTPPNEIKKDSFLKKYVNLYFEQFIKIVNAENEIKKKDVEKIINLVTLIEPFQIEDQTLVQLISETEDIVFEDVLTVFNAMREQSIVSGRYQYEIKPDIYSDLILEKALDTRKWLESKLPVYGVYMNNVIKNIGYVFQDSAKNSVLVNIMKGYINSIDNCSNYTELAKILETIYSITYIMPLLASEAVAKTLSIYHNEYHPLNNEFRQSLIYKNYSLDSTINNLKNILRSLSQLEEYYVQSYEYSAKLYRILNDDGIISNISSFSKNDRYNGFNCKIQNLILKASNIEFKKEDNTNKPFALKALKNLLKLEFTNTEPHLFQKYSLQIFTFSLPENKFVKKLRKDIITILIDQFDSEWGKEYQEEILKLIIDIPREIFSTRNKYKGKDEIKNILDFLLVISTQNILELKLKQFIKDQLHWFKKWGIDNSFHETIDIVIKNISGTDLAEILLNLFDPKFEESIVDEGVKFESKAEIFIKSYSGVDLGNALVKVIEQSEYTPLYFYQFLDLIILDIDKTKELISHLWVTNRVFVISHCSNIFRKLRFSETDENFYWEYVDRLCIENQIDTRNCILSIYNTMFIHDVLVRLNNNILKEKDSELIIKTHNNSTVENYYNLAASLPTLLYQDKQIAIKTLERFLQVCNARHLDRLFLTLNEFKDEYYIEIRNLLLEHTINHSDIPYNVERLLNRIIKEDGFSIVLRYFEKRLLYNRKYIIANKTLLGYEYVPRHSGKAIISDFSDIQKEEIFSDVLKWYINFEFEPYEHLYSNHIIELFATSKYINTTSKTTYIELIETNKSNYNKLISIIQSISEFKEKTENLIDLIIKILGVVNNSTFNIEQIRELSTQCYIALTSLGVKTGTPGQPFDVDLALKDLLEKTLKSSKINSPKIKDFFVQVLRSVQSEIDRDRFEEGGDSW